MIYFDTETCGFHGPIVLYQWAEDGGPINLHNVWDEPVGKTLELYEALLETEICGFNLAFDWFHVCQQYTTLSLLDPREIPIISEYAIAEREARSGPCLRPQAACDLMLHARRGPYQDTMQRAPITIRRVPTALAQPLANELTARIKLKDVYFTKSGGRRWTVEYIEVEDKIDPDFRDVTLRFSPSSALKALAVDALGIKEVTRFEEIGLKLNPVEVGFAPFALAIGTEENWKGSWPDVIARHISHWAYSRLAIEYAIKDVEYTRALHKHFGSPKAGDMDSELACMIGAVRWKGFAVNAVRLAELREKARIVAKSAPRDHRAVRRWFYEVLNEFERKMITSTDKSILEELKTWDDHPIVERATAVSDARRAVKEVEIYDKLIVAGRFHASFDPLGARSGRMSGSGGDLNAQGIKRTKEIRACFPLKSEGEGLSGGDFDSFEVGIAEALYDDPDLRRDLTSGKKIHGLFGQALSGWSYDQVLASEGKEPDWYVRGKMGVFAMIYHGTAYTLQKKLGVTEEVAENAFHQFINVRYPGIARAQKKIYDAFCSMRQPGGLGTAVEWHDPAEFVESMLGFRRYFTLENRICKELFDLAEDPPSTWTKLKIKVVRSDRQQTASGACRSALFGAAFGIQAASMRAAGNHRVQSTGATITKDLQARIWELQPRGLAEWVVAPLNQHDEIMVVHNGEVVDDLKVIVAECIEHYKPLIPLIGMTWMEDMNTWADK